MTSDKQDLVESEFSLDSMDGKVCKFISVPQSVSFFSRTFLTITITLKQRGFGSFEAFTNQVTVELFR